MVNTLLTDNSLALYNMLKSNAKGNDTEVFFKGINISLGLDRKAVIQGLNELQISGMIKFKSMPDKSGFNSYYYTIVQPDPKESETFVQEVMPIEEIVATNDDPLEVEKWTQQVQEIMRSVFFAYYRGLIISRISANTHLDDDYIHGIFNEAYQNAKKETNHRLTGLFSNYYKAYITQRTAEYVVMVEFREILDKLTPWQWVCEVIAPKLNNEENN